MSFISRATYPKFVPEGILINILGITIVALAAVVLFVVTNSAYKRVEVHDEHQALMAMSDDWDLLSLFLFWEIKVNLN